jgi:hypothetical protein
MGSMPSGYTQPIISQRPLGRALEAEGSALIELVTDPEALTVCRTLSKLRSSGLARLAKAN